MSADSKGVEAALVVTKTNHKAEQKAISRHRRRVRDAVLHVIVSIVFSCALGLFFVHVSMLWHQYHSGYWSGIFSGSAMFDGLSSSEQNIFTFARRKNDIYEWSGGQLRVNTSLYVW